MNDEDLAPAVEHLKKGGDVAIPKDGLGTGLALLHENAPETLNYLKQRIRELYAL